MEQESFCHTKGERKISSNSVFSAYLPLMHNFIDLRYSYTRSSVLEGPTEDIVT
jgi:hypothetical protein